MKLLIALDLSEATAKILDAVRNMPAGAAPQARVLHVAEPNPDFIGYEAGPEVVREQVAEEFRRQHSAVQQAASELRAAGVEASALLIQGVTVDAIVEQAKEFQADLIVMGTHGRSALFDVFVGSVSQGVIRKSDVPVLLVPTH